MISVADHNRSLHIGGLGSPNRLDVDHSVDRLVGMGFGCCQVQGDLALQILPGRDGVTRWTLTCITVGTSNKPLIPKKLLSENRPRTTDPFLKDILPVKPQHQTHTNAEVASLTSASNVDAA